MFAMHEVHSANGQSSKYVYVNIPSSIIETFAVDAKSDIIYFVDIKNNLLKKHDIKEVSILYVLKIKTFSQEKKDVLLIFIAYG